MMTLTKRSAKFTKLTPKFFQQEDTVKIAKDLLGKVLVTNFEGKITSGVIVETEAYTGIEDKASHAFDGKRTERTEVMYREGGVAYVYLIYGLHQMFNIVTGKRGVPNAVLIRGIEPIDGLEFMLQRRKKLRAEYTLTRGPGAVAEAFGLDLKQSGAEVFSDLIWVEDRGTKVLEANIACGPRVGVEYADEHADLPYRFFFRGNNWVSKPNK